MYVCIRLTLQKPEISAGSMGHMALQEFSLKTIIGSKMMQSIGSNAQNKHNSIDLDTPLEQ